MFVIGSENLLAILFLVFLNGCFTAIATPSRSAFLPLIVEGENLVKANSMFATSQSIVMLISTVLGGIATNFLMYQMVLAIDVLSFLLSILIILTIRSKEKIQKLVEKKSYIGDLKENFHFVKENTVLKTVVGYSMSRNFIAGFVYVFFTYHILNSLDLGPIGLSYGYIASGLGQISGAFCMNNFFKDKVNNKSFYKIIYVSSILLLAFHSLSYTVNSVILFLLFNLLANLFYNPIGITVDVIIAKNTSEKKRGNVFFVSHFFAMISYLIGFIVVGFLFSLVNYITVLSIVTIISVLLICLLQRLKNSISIEGG